MFENPAQDELQKSKSDHQRNSRLGLWLGGTLGFAGLALVALTTPFVLPALRRHCLPYVPATDQQLCNLNKAFKRHAKLGDKFVDIGSGDGRICREAARLGIFSQVHGVELNYPLVLYSRILSWNQPNKGIRFFHRDLWKFPIGDYDSICIFGVESMMDALRNYLLEQSKSDQMVFACRFPFKDLEQVGEIGEGIDTVWVYRVTKPKRAA